MTAEQKVKAKYPDAVSTFGTANSLLSVLIWSDSNNGPVIGRGVTANTDWVDAELNAWEDAASRIEAGQ